MANENRPESLADAIEAVVSAEFGTQVALAKALGGMDPSTISHYKSGKERMQPATLEGLMAVVRSPALQHRLFRAWSRQFEPPPDLPPGTPAHEVIEHLTTLVESDLVEQAIRLAEIELERSPDYEHWFAIAERLQPLYLRLAHVSQALLLRTNIERRAEEVGHRKGVLAALSMTETALFSIEAATPHHAERAHDRSLAALEWWQPKGADEKHDKDIRTLNLHRTRAQQILRFSTRKRGPLADLDQALKDVRASMGDAPDYVIASALEMQARIEAAAGRVFAAEETIERLEAFGLERAWEMWEKSRLTLARVAERRGDVEQAIEILTDVRDYCRAHHNLHHALRADQELARILLLTTAS